MRVKNERFGNYLKALKHIRNARVPGYPPAGKFFHLLNITNTGVFAIFI